jgi:hypothetical protein
MLKHLGGDDHLKRALMEKIEVVGVTDKVYASAGTHVYAQVRALKEDPRRSVDVQRADLERLALREVKLPNYQADKVLDGFMHLSR